MKQTLSFHLIAEFGSIIRAVKEWGILLEAIQAHFQKHVSYFWQAALRQVDKFVAFIRKLNPDGISNKLEILYNI